MAAHPELPALLDGLHFHTLCEQNADALAVTLAAVEKKFADLLPRMKWLNFGGGHHITRPGYALATLENCILSVRQKYGVQVYLEPGEAWALNAGYLVTTVLDTLRNGNTSLAILDMSAACHTPDVIEMPYRPPLLDAGEPGEKPCTFRLGGPTCLAGDVVGDYSFAAPLTEGSRLIFGDMAIYSTCKNNIESWGSSIISWFKDKLDINSPSRVFRQLGVYSVEGYNEGIEKEGAKTKGFVTSWTDSFSNMEVNLGTRLKIDNAALKDYQNNYGSDFTNEAIVQRVTREVSTRGTVQATLNSGGGLKDAIKEALDDLGITTAVNDISRNTKTQADKKEQTIVEIGGKTVTDAVTTQRNANGYSFQGA